MSEITKKALAESLKRLLSKKELSKITIKNVADECGVNRQTFYYHFKDIYDLIEWIYTNEVIDEIKDRDTYESWKEGFLFIFNYVLANKNFVINTYHSTGKEYLMRFLYEQTRKMIINVIEEKSKDITLNNEDKQFIADFYKYGLVGVMQDWIANGMKEKPEEIIKKLNVILEGNFENAVENLNKNRQM